LREVPLFGVAAPTRHEDRFHVVEQHDRPLVRLGRSPLGAAEPLAQPLLALPAARARHLPAPAAREHDLPWPFEGASGRSSTNCWLSSQATRRARLVLPMPGGPDRKKPLIAPRRMPLWHW